jgi:2-C-methyl-D-erythritol 4-phosphate cytidylyltransferase
MSSAVVVAGGQGVRFGCPEGKQLALLAGRPMLYWGLAAMEQASSIREVAVVFAPEGVVEVRSLVAGWAFGKVKAVVAGGRTRRESVSLGLAALGPDVEAVAVHDGARPLVLPVDIDSCVAALPGWDGVVLGRPACDTIKRAADGGAVLETLSRRELWLAETPQVFRLTALRAAHAAGRAPDGLATDDAALVELAGGKVRMVAATGLNLKVTVPEDLILAEAVLEQRRKS